MVKSPHIFSDGSSIEDFIRKQQRGLGKGGLDNLVSPELSTGKKYKKLPFCTQHPKKKLEFYKEYKNPDEYDTPYYCRKGDEWIDREDILWRKILIK